MPLFCVCACILTVKVGPEDFLIVATLMNGKLYLIFGFPLMASKSKTFSYVSAIQILNCVLYAFF